MIRDALPTPRLLRAPLLALPLLALPLLASLAALAAPLQAQEAGGDAEEDRWRSRVELGLNAASGNKSFAILRSALSVKHLRTDVAEVEWATSYRYGKSEGEVISNELKSALKVDWRPEDRWSPFAFAEAVRDPIRRLDVRASGGGGLKYAFWRGETGSASISDALLFEYEDFDQRAGTATVPSQENLRWSLRLKGEKTLGGEATVQHTSFWQPVFDALDDYLFEAKTTLSTPVFGGVDLALEHEYLHDATPPPGVARDDQRFSVLFRLDL